MTDLDTPPAAPPAAPDFAAMRAAMIDTQLRTNAVIDPAVVAAMAVVPREAFVSDALRVAAYSDRSLALSATRRLNAPLVLGRLLVAADIMPGQRVLLIGAGSGYGAAVLAAMGAAVTALESDADLLAMAGAALAGVDGAVLIGGPMDDPLAALGAGTEPFARIIVDGAMAQLPAAVVAALADGGVMAAGVADGPVTRLARGVKVGGALVLRAFADLDMARLPGFDRPAGFQF